MAGIPIAAVVNYTATALTVANGFQQLHGIYNSMRSNPGKARSEALQKCREDSKAHYEKSVARMEELKKKFDDAAEKSQAEADRRYKEQLAVNQAAQEAIEKRIRESEEKYDANMSKMQADHQKQMNELREASKEEREKAANEHKKKMADLEKKHDKEKQEANQKLEEAKKEGDRQIAQASAEVEAVAEERAKNLKSYEEEMEKVMKANHEQLMKLNKDAMDMRMANSKLRIENIKKEKETMLLQITMRTDELLKHFQTAHSREVILKFKGVLEKFNETSNSLEHVGTKCLLPDTVEPGELDPDFLEISTGRALYQNRVKCYRMFAMNATHANPKVLQICSQFINDMNDVMEDRTLLEITTNLPKAIDVQNVEIIEKYQKKAEDMRSKFLTLNQIVENKLATITHKVGETKAIEK